jgi:phosphate uptake regulator
MAFRFLRDEGTDRLEAIEAKVQEMLRYDRHEFELAMSALMGDVVAREVNNELRSTDQKVNRLEREIRRELLVHVSVFGGISTPAVLVFMSVVKDVERVGDYAKNILDLALDGANFSVLPDAEQWRQTGREISEFIEEAGEVFRTRHSERTRKLLAEGDRLLDLFDAEVSRLVKEGDGEAQAVPRALAIRYLKRVVAHLMNLLSAVVMPLDRLDYFDEDPEDRASR